MEYFFDVTALVMGALLLVFLLGSALWTIYCERRERLEEEKEFFETLEKLHNKEYGEISRELDRDETDIH